METNQNLNNPMEDNNVETKIAETSIEQCPAQCESIPIVEEQKCCCNGGEEPKVACKKGSLHCLFGIVMALAIVVLYVLHFTSAPKGKQNPNATAPVVAEGNLKIAYIDTDTLMAKYEYAIALREENEQYQKQLENQFTSEATKLQNDYTKLQSDYQSFTQNDYKNMTLTQQNAKDEDLKKRGAEIEKKMQQMQGRQAEYATKAAEKLQKDSETMTNAVYAFIREYNDANQQFDIILAKSFTSSPVLYGNPGMDITDEILEGLNKEYKEVKGKKGNNESDKKVDTKAKK